MQVDASRAGIGATFEAIEEQEKFIFEALFK
jgi:hypothetical protein